MTSPESRQDSFAHAFKIQTLNAQPRLTSKKQSILQETMSDLPVCDVVFVSGGPGAGKDRLNGWVHLSAGDLIRRERKSGGKLRDLINATIVAGELVPSEITCKCLEGGMFRAFEQSGVTKFLIDGFPRSQENLACWTATALAKHNINFVLSFHCPDSVLEERLLERGKSSGRADDNIDTIRKRFQTHKTETLPIIQYCENNGIAVCKIESDKEVEQVYEKVVAFF